MLAVVVSMVTAALAADPVIEWHGERIDDPHRWLEADDGLALAWQRARDAEARAQVTDDGYYDAVLDWLDEARAVALPVPRLLDHRAGVSLWSLRERADPAYAAGEEAWNHRVYVQGPGMAFPGDPVDDQFAREVCAGMLAPAGRTAVVGRSTADGDCELRLFDRELRRSQALFTGRRVQVAWDPSGQRLMVAHLADKRARLTEVSRAGEATLVHEGKRGLDLLGWLPDGRLVGLSAHDHKGRTTRDVQWVLGEPAALAWFGEEPLGRYDLVGVHGDEVLVMTTARANGGEVVRIAPDATGPEAWRSVVAERPGMDLIHARRDGDNLLTVWSRDGLEHLEVQPFEGGASVPVDLGPATSVRVFRAASDDAVIEAHGPGTHQWWARGDDGTLTSLGSPYTRPDLRFRVAAVPSSGGVEVPLTLLHRVGHGPDVEGAAPGPVWLQVYGGFGRGQQLALSEAGELWLAAGGAIAVVHARGGRERGEAWHTGATGAAMTATFDDVEAAARWLVDAGWTEPGRIALVGTSNGALSVAATVLRAPELFGAAWGHAGVYDLLRGPVMGEMWWPEEYGDPEVPEQAATLRAASVVHQVPERLPPLLLTTGTWDRVVPPSHSRKLMAAWEEVAGGPVLLRADPFGSHGTSPPADVTDPGARARHEAQAHTMAFLLRALELPVPDPPTTPPLAVPPDEDGEEDP